MIENSLKRIEDTYNRLDEDSRKRLYEILVIFTEFLDNPKSYADIHNYLLRKRKSIAIGDDKSYDASDLIDYIKKHRDIPPNQILKIEKIVWYILKKGYAFENTSEVQNFLEYLFNVNIRGKKSINSRNTIIKIYQDLYTSLNINEKVPIMSELSKRVLVEIPKDRLMYILHLLRMK